MESNGESFSPYIRCLIEEEEIEVLVDTGATISVLTKEIVDTIIKRSPKIPQLPVTGVKISNAVGKQICKTSKQVFCQCQLGEVTIITNFIQVEGLNERGIIGSDILNKYNTQIEFDNHTIAMKVSGQIHLIQFSKKLPKITKHHQLSRLFWFGALTHPIHHPLNLVGAWDGLHLKFPKVFESTGKTKKKIREKQEFLLMF
ncbi:hypothetical protein QTP88_008173 [Uroleucon formosanum]